MNAIVYISMFVHMMVQLPQALEEIFKFFFLIFGWKSTFLYVLRLHHIVSGVGSTHSQVKNQSYYTIVFINKYITLSSYQNETLENNKCNIIVHDLSN